MASTVWKGRIAFGMVSIPVRMYKAARRERIRFHHVVRAAGARMPELDAEPEPEPPQIEEREEFKAPSPVQHGEVERIHLAPVRGPEEAPVERPQMLKAYEVEKDQYAVFEPEEIKALRPRTSTEVTIGEFVKLDEIDPVYFDTSYYLAPERGAEKPYALLFQALKASGYAALGSLAMHGREHVAVIRPGKTGLILHTLFYNNEVRSNEEFRTDPSTVNSRELELAGQLVSMMADTFDPAKLKDAFEERVRELVESRAPVAAAGASAIDAGSQTPVIDIAEALRKSLERIRKPARSEAGKPAAARRRKAR
jgi:DNA end-binding protein Ku